MTYRSQLVEICAFVHSRLRNCITFWPCLFWRSLIKKRSSDSHEHLDQPEVGTEYPCSRALQYLPTDQPWGRWMRLAAAESANTSPWTKFHTNCKKYQSSYWSLMTCALFELFGMLPKIQAVIQTAPSIRWSHTKSSSHCLRYHSTEKDTDSSIEDKRGVLCFQHHPRNRILVDENAERN